MHWGSWINDVPSKAIEAVGLLAAVHLLWRGLPAVAVTHLPKGRLT